MSKIEKNQNIESYQMKLKHQYLQKNAPQYEGVYINTYIIFDEAYIAQTISYFQLTFERLDSLKKESDCRLIKDKYDITELLRIWWIAL